MAETNWMSYVGVTTGIIGTISGLAGAAMGYIGYRRSVRMKTLDMRLELRKADNTLRGTIGALPALLEFANRSRTRVAAAIGMHSSGAMQVWSTDVVSDRAVIGELQSQVPATDVDYMHLTDSELEAKLVAAHTMSLRANGIKGKYDAAIAADDQERQRIKDHKFEEVQRTLDRNNPR